MRKSIESYQSKRLEEFDQSWIKQILPNGMLAVHIPRPNDDQFYLETMIKSGSRNESKATSGLSHFLEHMMFRGTKKYPKFTTLASEFEWLGGEWNAATGYEHTEYSYDGIRHSAPETIALFSEFIENPAMNNIEVEREIILREIEGDLNEFDHSTDLDFHLSKLLWPNSNMAYSILGDEETVETITIEDLQKQRLDYYFPRNMTIMAVGGETNKIMPLLENAFGNYRLDSKEKLKTNYAKTPSYTGPLFKWIEDSNNEYQILHSFAIEGEFSDNDCLYEIIIRILSDGFCSRLSSRIREELGLVYDVDATATRIAEAGTFEISADIHTSKLEQYTTEMLRIVESLKNDGPNEDELQRAILRSIVDLELSPSEPEGIGSRVCWAHLSDEPFSLVQYREKYRSITKDQVTQMCRKIFTKENLAVVIMGPKRIGLEETLLQIANKEIH
jgi:predicted Zn-dependent peptidase